jgi:hypothetical protein
MNHEPFALRGNDQLPEWYFFIEGRQFGPWPDKGSAAAGYQTELRRAAKRREEDERDADKTA